MIWANIWWRGPGDQVHKQYFFSNPLASKAHSSSANYAYILRWIELWICSERPYALKGRLGYPRGLESGLSVMLRHVTNESSRIVYITGELAHQHAIYRKISLYSSSFSRYWNVRQIASRWQNGWVTVCTQWGLPWVRKTRKLMKIMIYRLSVIAFSSRMILRSIFRILIMLGCPGVYPATAVL